MFTMEDGRPVSPDFIDKRFPAFLEQTPYIYCEKCKKAFLDDDPPAVCPECKKELAPKPLRRVRFHDLRHSCASLLFAQGCPLRLVMEILGHSQIALTANTYTHLYAEANREAAAAMQTLLAPKS